MIRKMVFEYCCRCEQNKSREEFYLREIDVWHPNGVSWWCKSCIKFYNFEYHAKHAERVNAIRRLDRVRNLQAARAREKEYRDAHIEVVRQQSRESYARHRDVRVEEMCARYAANRDDVSVARRADYAAVKAATGKPDLRKLTDEKVRAIRQRLSLNHSKASIARDYGVTPECIGAIASGKTWKHVV